ncbi:hypothetical protein [Brevibacillus laterosporus]|uniref:Uncharacterized protein n=1 Tax=Brevibacillus laterosporus TaxID=1465 RepID=A0AAP8QEU3_BRELA|nr:hypothetical protein [Brevibacillus laterosporus]PPA80911.1 hypothetical protein C4A76_24830 [Brevibacillus laterosporus]PPB08869.1 hypothetical protein C4A77_06170 [Brevibacillus laterosporus]
MKSGEILGRLYEKQAIEQDKVTQLKSQIRKARKSVEVVEEFEMNSVKQRRRLEIINIFKNPRNPDDCPLCQQTLPQVTQPVKEIQKVIAKVSHDLKDVERERPRLDGYIRKLTENLQKAEEVLSAVNKQITAVIKEKENSERLDLIQRRNRVIGRISFYLEAGEQTFYETTVRQSKN